MRCFSLYLRIDIVVKSELMGVRFSIELVVVRDWTSLWLESNYMLFICSFNRLRIIHWCFRSKWKSCMTMNYSLNFKVLHIFYEGNKCVHRLASLGVESNDKNLFGLKFFSTCISQDFLRNKFGLYQTIDFFNYMGFCLISLFLYFVFFFFYVHIFRKSDS